MAEKHYTICMLYVFHSIEICLLCVVGIGRCDFYGFGF